MPTRAVRHRHRPSGLATLSPAFEIPDPNPVQPANANVLEMFITNEQGIVIVFDRIVIVDPASPPTTWNINGSTSIQAGSINFGNCSYLVWNGIVNPGSPVIFAADDPRARTADGGYVNAVTTTLADL